MEPPTFQLLGDLVYLLTTLGPDSYILRLSLLSSFVS